MATTLNGQGIIAGRLALPLLGAWEGDFIVDNPADIVGPCTITSEGGLTLAGVASRGAAYEETTYVRVVGGIGGLAKKALPRHYHATSIRGVLVDLQRASGEKLSPTADPTVLSLQLPAWTQRAQTVGAALSSLVSDRRLGGAAAWRLLADGTIWVGRESWPDAGIAAPTDYQQLGASPAEGWIDLGFETLRVLPGMSLEGRHCSYLDYQINAAGIRARAWVEPS